MQFTQPKIKLFVVFLVVLGNSLLMFACKPGLPTTDLLQTTTPSSVTLPVLTPSSVSPRQTNTSPPPSATPSPTSTEVIRSTASPTPTPQVFDADIKLAYAVRVMEGDQVRTIEYWILEPPYEVPRKVAEIEYNKSPSDPRLSHSGDKIAFVKIENGQMILVTVNVNTLESESFPIPANQPKPDVPYIYWSYDDRWLAIKYKMEDNFDIDRTIIVDTNTRESGLFENGTEFCEWFRDSTDQFLFLQKDIGTPNPSPEDSPVGEIAIHVKRVADDISSLVINQMLKYTTWVPYCNLTLSPDGKIAIVVGSDGVISKFDLINGSWEKLPGQIKGEHPYPWLWWSPEGRWILVYLGRKDLYFWDFYQDLPALQISLPVMERLGAIGWTGDSEWVVYEDGNAFYAFNPNDQHKIKLFDSPRVADWTNFSLWVE